MCIENDDPDLPSVLGLTGTDRPRDDEAQLLMAIGMIVNGEIWHDWRRLATGSAVILIYALEMMRKRTLANEINDKLRAGTLTVASSDDEVPGRRGGTGSLRRKGERNEASSGNPEGAFLVFAVP